MFDILIWLLILAISLTILAKASNKFTEAAERIGLFLRISPFVVGVTIVAVGTSLPELISSIIAVIQGNSEIVVANVIGSNITNVLLILGLSALVAKRIQIKESFLRIDLMVFITSAFILTIIILNGTVTIIESIILLLCFVAYINYIIKTKKPKEKIKPNIKKEPMSKKVYIILIISVAIIFISAYYTIESIVNLSNLIGIGKEIIAVTVVALGTSLPELAVSISAIRKGKTEIAIGNILGSNIFNIFLITGIAGLFGTLIVPTNIIITGSFFMILSTFLYYFSIKDRNISKWEGTFLLLLYLLFIVEIIGWA
jgi:cation:H+ antiporter